MRILFVAPYVPSLIRVRPYHFIRELARRHEVTLLASAAGRELSDAATIEPLCRSVHLVPRTLARSLQSCASGAWRGEPLQAAVCRSPAFARRLAELLAERSYDVVHVEHLRAAHARDGIPDGMPTVWDAVDSISLLLERTLLASHCRRQRAIALLELQRTRAFEARMLGRFDRVATTSPDDARALHALSPGSPLTVIPNGVDLEYFQPLGAPREPATLVLSGKMSYHANVTAALHFLREIFPLVRRARPDVRLRIVGSNPPAGLQAFARDPSITVSGYVPDIRPAIGTATLAVCPVTVKVGIQNKLLEAMAMGLPAVSSREGVEGLSAEPGRDLLVAESPSAFAQQVVRLLEDPMLCDQVGRAGRRYVETQHRWDAAARQLEALYVQAVDRPMRVDAHGAGVFV